MRRILLSLSALVLLPLPLPPLPPLILTTIVMVRARTHSLTRAYTHADPLYVSNTHVTDSYVHFQPHHKLLYVRWLPQWPILCRAISVWLIDLNRRLEMPNQKSIKTNKINWHTHTHMHAFIFLIRFAALTVKLAKKCMYVCAWVKERMG